MRTSVSGRAVLGIALALLITAAATGDAKADPIPVPNFSFEAPHLADGGFTVNDPIPGWTLATSGGSVFPSVGVFNPMNAQYPDTTGEFAPLPGTADGAQCGYINLPGTLAAAGSFTSSSSLATVQADTLYTLTVALGRRLDVDVDDVTIALLVDGSVVASSSIQGASLPVGTFTDLSVSFRALSDGGDLRIQLSYSRPDTPILVESQGNFDNVRLEMTF